MPSARERGARDALAGGSLAISEQARGVVRCEGEWPTDRVRVSDRAYDCLTIADACVDLVVDLGEVVPRFGQAEQWVANYHLELGGSACLFACQAARLGLRVGILGRVGDDDFGRLVLRRLTESGVDTRFMAVDAGLKTGLGVALCRPGGDRAILTYGGSLDAVHPADVSDDFLASGRHLHYASYYLLGSLRPSAAAILGRAKALGLSVSLDTNWDPSESWNGGLEEALRQCDLFLPNEAEARAITRQADLTAATEVLARRVPTVVVKLGARGCLVARRGERWVVSVEEISQPADTIGAGDSFDAGFVAGYLRGLPPPECAAIANACGQATTLAQGGLASQLGWKATRP